MQKIFWILLGMCLGLMAGGDVMAAETQSWWWPFGGDQPAAVPSASATSEVSATAPADDADLSPSADTSWFNWLKNPLVQRPQGSTTTERASLPRRGPTARQRPKNAWAKSDAEPAEQSPPLPGWQSVTRGARRLGQATRSAWGKTVHALSPGETAARREPRVSWWDRMWGEEEEAESGPRTVTEWMAQERLGP